jgi:7-cyano-7-deazaguanine synthase
MSAGFVLLSGGVDSTTCLYLAKKRHDRVYAYSFDYGQIHSIERGYAQISCNQLSIPYSIIDMGSQPDSAMTSAPMNAEIPDKSYNDLGEGVSPSYHWFRNGQMLALAAAHAHALLDKDEKGVIYAGQHAEDASNWAYPDCTFEFLGAMANAIFIGTYMQLRLENPLVFMNKAEVVRLGEELGVRWSSTYSCYHGGVYHCGTCPTCRARKEAFVKANVPDPTVYKA